MGFSFKAMWTNKCPRCRQGSIFVEPFNFTDPLNMPDKCSYCGQVTEPEPGFYYGAMFISYLASVFLLLGPSLLLVFYFKWSLNATMGFVIFLGLISFLKVLRGSRSTWFHLMVNHDPEIENEVNLKIKNSIKRNWKPNL